MGAWQSTEDLELKPSSLDCHEHPPPPPPIPPSPPSMEPDANQKYVVYLERKARDGKLSTYRLDVVAPDGAVFVTG